MYTLLTNLNVLCAFGDVCHIEEEKKQTNKLNHTRNKKLSNGEWEKKSIHLLRKAIFKPK